MRSALQNYIDAAGDAADDFAWRIGVSAERFRRILMAEIAPTPGEARRIVDACGGAVDFEAVYAPFGGAPVAAIEDGSSADEFVNVPGLAASLRTALDETGQRGAARLPNEILLAVAEAAANTQAALAGVTTRRGTDRLAQALLAVLEETLKDFPATAPGPQTAPVAAQRAAALYYRDFPPE
jgi:hypothetical protein